MTLNRVMGIIWTFLALASTLSVESWSFFPDGTAGHWWPQVGVKAVVAFLFFEISSLKKTR